MSEAVEERSFETKFMEFQMVCRRCQSQWQPPIARFVNVKTDPDARMGILLGTMHYSYCPQCKLKQFINTTFEYYDPDQELVVQIRPEWEYKAGGGEDYYLKRFEELVHKYSDSDVRVDVVFGYQELIDKYLGGEEAIAEAREEWHRRRAIAMQKSEQQTKSDVAFMGDTPEDDANDDQDDSTTA